MKRTSGVIGKIIWSFLLFLGRKGSGLEKQRVMISGTSYMYLAPANLNPDLETIVLVHGFTGFKEYWSEFMRACTSNANFFAIDLPGHGESGFDQGSTFQQQASELIHSVINQHNLKHVHFVGASVGAWVACLFALERPAFVKTLTLIGPVGIPATSGSEFYNRIDEGKNPFWVSTRQDYSYLLGLAMKNPPPQFWPLSDYLLADYTERQPIYKLIWAQITDCHEHVLPLDLARLSELPCTKFVIMGEEERTIHDSILSILTDEVRGIGVHACPDSGHAVQCDRPNWLAHFVDTKVVRSS